MDTRNYFYALVSIGSLAVILLVWIAFLEARLRKFFRGKSGANLENTMVLITEELKKLNLSRQEMEKYLEVVETRLKASVQFVNTVRFNPFEGAGSNQSFSVAFLDEKGDGAVISSLYSREGVRVYAKPVKNKKSEYALSDEENEAINGTKQ